MGFRQIRHILQCGNKRSERGPGAGRTSTLRHWLCVLLSRTKKSTDQGNVSILERASGSPPTRLMAFPPQPKLCISLVGRWAVSDGEIHHRFSLDEVGLNRIRRCTRHPDANAYEFRLSGLLNMVKKMEKSTTHMGMMKGLPTAMMPFVLRLRGIRV